MYSNVVGTGWNGIERHQRTDIVSCKGKKGREKRLQKYIYVKILYIERGKKVTGR